MRRHRHSRVQKRRIGPGDFEVRARVERFAEPAVLLLLRERPVHGYELLEQLPEVTGERVDMGNLTASSACSSPTGSSAPSGTTGLPARASGSTS